MEQLACQTPIGPYVLHAISSPTSYARHHLELPPTAVPTGPSTGLAPSLVLPPRRNAHPPVRPRPGERSEWGQPVAPSRVETAWEDEVAQRRRVYVEGVYALHMASNTTTRFKPAPSPSELASTPHLQSLLRSWLMRELHALPCSLLDLSFLLTYTLAILRTVHVRSEEAVVLLAEFVGRQLAQHLLAETYAFLRSGKSVRVYDHLVRYAWPTPRTEAAQTRSNADAQPVSSHHVVGSASRESSRRKGAASETRQRFVSPPASTDVVASDTGASAAVAVVPLDAVDAASRAAPRAEVANLRTRLLERLEAERRSGVAVVSSIPSAYVATAEKRRLLLERLHVERAAAVASTTEASRTTEFEQPSRRSTLLLRLERERAQQTTPRTTP